MPQSPSPALKLVWLCPKMGGNAMPKKNLGSWGYPILSVKNKHTAKHLSMYFVLARHHSPAAALWPC